MIPHIVRIAAVAGIAGTVLLVVRQVIWERQMLRDLKTGGHL